MKGNEAIVKGAILAGCRAFYGYPDHAGQRNHGSRGALHAAGGRRLSCRPKAKSPRSTCSMAPHPPACARMTASSGPGISLMQEGISYLAGAELPCVIADIMRGGPGLGNIAPEQSDYHQVVKGGGHGSYRTIVLAPDSVQEMVRPYVLAFDLADKYRNPVFVLADGYIGQMMEPVEFPPPRRAPRRPHGRWQAPPSTAQPDHLHLPGTG